jgi:hypothetical protein
MRGRIATAVLLIVFLAGTGASLAQVPEVLPAIGAKAGVNLSRFQVQGTSTSNRTGFVGGAYGRAPLSPYLSLVIEGLYAQKGFTRNSFTNTAGTITNWEVKLGYLEFPVLFRFDIPSQGIHPYLSAGIAPGILLSADQKSSATAGEWTDLKSQLKSSNWTLVFGVGFDYKRWLLDFRFNHGLTELAGEQNLPVIKDRTFSIALGYSFLL